MAIGPIQVIVFAFERTDKFSGEILEELANLRGRHLIRLIDLFAAIKTPAGDIIALEIEDLSEQESAEFGRVLGKLMGIRGLTVKEVATAAMERTLDAAAVSIGLDYQDLRQLVEDMPLDRAFGVLMFEHTWAIPLTSAIRRAGGIPLAQGFVTPEALVMVGEELNAIIDAADTIQAAEIVKDIAILDTLATLEEAEAIKTAIAADVLRTLIAAELIEEAIVEDAINRLSADGLLDTQYLEAGS